MHSFPHSLPKRAKLLLFAVGLVIFLSFSSLIYGIWRKEALHDAVRRGDVQAIVEILDRNPQSIERRDRLGMTPLHVAAYEGQIGAMEILIRRGADLHSVWDLPKTGEARWTPLHICGIQGHVKASELLLRANSDVNAKSLLGRTPLDIAIENGHTELIAFLRSQGAVQGVELNPNS